MLSYNELENRLKEIEIKNNDISNRIKTFGDSVNENKDRIRLLSLDASIESKYKTKELISEKKIENEVVELHGDNECTELDLYIAYVNKLSRIEDDNGDKIVNSDGLSMYKRYSFIERIKQKIILYILRYVDDDYLYDKLWNKIIK